MEINKTKSVIEAILFAAGREVTKKEIMLQLEMPEGMLEQMELTNYVQRKIYMNIYILYWIKEQNLKYQMQQWKLCQ